MTQSKDQIETRMRELTDFITQSSEKVRGGQMVSLHHLDDEVASLCDAAVSLPPEEAGKVQPLMAMMIAQLEDLANALKDYQQAKRDGA